VSDFELLKYWDGTLYVDDPPQKTFEDGEGNWVALWWWPAQEWWWDGKKNHHRTLDVIGGAERVTFTPEVFRVERWVDVIEWHSDDPPCDEDGEPYYTERGEEFYYEGVEFPRDAFANFLKDVITGRLVHKGYRWVPADKIMFLKQRSKLPRTREEMAQWVKSAGYAASSNGSGGDYTDDFPEGVPETP
jgi:hypothetical protein